jgi:hypothetical protein
MTPQERKLLDELFYRLASLENAPRDGDAVDAINQGLERAPNALYPLVQTVLVQDEALKRANARIQELENELGVDPGQPAQQPGFLDSMRDSLFGRREGQTQGSVPTVRPGTSGMSSAWGNTSSQGGAYAAPPPPPQQGYSGSPGGSFLGTAAASAAGVIGGALLMNSIRGMFGGHGSAHGAFDPGFSGGSPWGPSASGSDLARDAGINDIGSGGRSAIFDDDTQRGGLFDTAAAEDGDGDGDYDDGGDFGDGGSDTA